MGAHTPEKIITVNIHPAASCSPINAGIAFGSVSRARRWRSSRHCAGSLSPLSEKDASQVEVNPLIVTGAGQIVALDAKINIDGNALYRQRELAAAARLDQETRWSAKASEHDLTMSRSMAISLHGERRRPRDGTMDLIKLPVAPRPTFSTSVAAPPASRVTGRAS